MTTIKKKLMQALNDNYLPDHAAKVVWENFEADKINEPMSKRWNEPAEDYPPVLLSALWLNLKRHALTWVNENLPQAFYKSLFED